MSLINIKEQKTQDFVADYYEGMRFAFPFSRRYQMWFFKELINMLAPKGLVLDNGCGGGQLGEVLKDCRIIGVDLSANMLKHAAKRLSEVRQASAESLPFENNYFDSIFSRSLLHHLDHPEKAVSEMVRVLKPGGSVIFSDTLKNPITHIPRELMRKKSVHFSEGHKNFTMQEMLSLTGKNLEIVSIKYIGFIAYTLFGFPDVINFQKYIPFKRLVFPACLKIDQVLSKIPVLQKLAANIVVVAKKPLD